jgi:hypothetical protein
VFSIDQINNILTIFHRQNSSNATNKSSCMVKSMERSIGRIAPFFFFFLLFLLLFFFFFDTYYLSRGIGTKLSPSPCIDIFLGPQIASMCRSLQPRCRASFLSHCRPIRKDRYFGTEEKAGLRLPFSSLSAKDNRVSLRLTELCTCLLVYLSTTALSESRFRSQLLQYVSTLVNYIDGGERRC